MKILTITYSIGPGGTERATVNFASSYQHVGCDSRIWILGNGDDRKNTLENYGVLMYFDNVQGHEINKESLILWRPDIIHIHHFDKYIYNILLPFKDLGISIVETNVFSRPKFNEEYKIVDVSFQLAYWGFWKYHKLMRFKKNYPINLHLPNLVIGEHFSAEFPNGRYNLRKRLNLPENAFIAARVGQSHPSKWDRRIFDVIGSIVAKNVCIYFVFVGLPDKLKSELDSLDPDMRNKIYLIDYIEGDIALTEFYKSIDVFIHISKIGESFGYVLAESLLCNCPVVTLSTPFKDNAQFEVVCHGVGGYCAISINQFTDFLIGIYSGELKMHNKYKSSLIESRFSENALMHPLLDIFSYLINNRKQELYKISLKTFVKANENLKKQLELYKSNALFIRGMLELYHLPLIFKTINFLKKIR